MNRTSRSRSRLQLSQETIRILSSRALRRVEGARASGPQTTVIEPPIAEPPLTGPTITASTLDGCVRTQPVTLTNDLCQLG